MNRRLPPGTSGPLDGAHATSARTLAPDGVCEEEVRIPGPAGRLEGRLSYRPESTERRGVLVLPPHPRLGGDLANNVVRELAGSIARSGLTALRINYHGVGASEGAGRDALERTSYWIEISETEAQRLGLADVEAAAAWLEQASGIGISVAGYSFGGALALRLAARVRSVHRAAIIGLAGSSEIGCELSRIESPVLAIHADGDFATPAHEVARRLASTAGPVELEVLAGCDHFFRGREGEVAARAVEFLAGGLPERTRP